MTELFNNDKIGGKDRIHLGFALGKALEDIGEYANSFHYLFEANSLRNSQSKYSITDDINLFSQLKETFTKGYFAQLNAKGCPSRKPVFIVGIPPSGTTLVEQTLSMHSKVFGAGELVFLDRYIATHRAILPNPDEYQIDALGNKHIEMISELCHESCHITDKMPFNFIWMGLIKAALPMAGERCSISS